MPTTHLTTDRLQSIGEKLQERKKQLEDELKQFASKNPHATGDWQAKYVDFGRSEDENAAEVTMYSDNLSLERTLEKELRDVMNALSRITSGAYGTCRYCGQPIPEQRLLARPTSSACVSCKEEKKKGV
ncbi:MAG: TraR/DksA C4-type zinc finger protein [bacterium]|nr:TraR/DksA C4-type zinc finger protein [bacterium]